MRELQHRAEETRYCRLNMAEWGLQLAAVGTHQCQRVSACGLSVTPVCAEVWITVEACAPSHPSLALLQHASQHFWPRRPAFRPPSSEEDPGGGECRPRRTVQGPEESSGRLQCRFMVRKSRHLAGQGPPPAGAAGILRKGGCFAVPWQSAWLLCQAPRQSLLHGCLLNGRGKSLSSSIPCHPLHRPPTTDSGC